jgi:hypothetical protein
MKHINLWIIVMVMIISGLQLSACQQHLDGHHTEHPAEVVKTPGSDLHHVILTEKAIQRIDLKTDHVRDKGAQKVVPYSSLIYGPHGQTWIYTSPEPRTFVRYRVDVDYIEGDTVWLNDGPPTGTKIASVGVAELYGTEFEVGH